MVSGRCSIHRLGGPPNGLLRWWSAVPIMRPQVGASSTGPCAHQVVRRCHEIASKLGAGESTVARATEAADGLQPAEDLLNPFSQTLTHGVPRMAVVRPSIALQRPLVFCAT
jgi:hypothetical protein